MYVRKDRGGEKVINLNRSEPLTFIPDGVVEGKGGGVIYTEQDIHVPQHNHVLSQNYYPLYPIYS